MAIRQLVSNMLLILIVMVYGTDLPQADAAAATPVEAAIHADRPYVIDFESQRARCVRIVIHRSSHGQPCIDELEVYGSDEKVNLARAGTGAVASASSCLPGYAIHQVRHLNDGQYGNAHSWIAAGQADEWARIDLPEPAIVSRVIISRDRDGKYHDRVPTAFDICLSLDGANWQTVRRIETAAAVPPRRGPEYSGPFHLPLQPTWEQIRQYAFDCERYTWQRMSAGDHLSPLKIDRPALPGGEPYWNRMAHLDPLSRTLAQFDEMMRRLAQKGIDVTSERAEWTRLRTRQAELENIDASDPAVHRLYYDTRLAKRRLMFRDPDLAALERILFVKRFPYHASHNYSDILDSEFRPGGGVCLLQIPYRAGCLEPAAATVTTLFDASNGIARDAVADFDAESIYFAYRPNRSAVSGWKPYWHLRVMNVDGSDVRQITDGPFHDFYPCPLPDDGLAFVSTRVKARFLCWRPQAFVLFRMDADGSRMRPLSFANLSEWSPSVLRDGRILWTRSEYLDKGADFGHTLWTIHPDGTRQELVFGNDTPNCYVNGHEVPGTGEICCTLFSHGGDHNGPIGLIDRSRGPFDTDAITNITPDVTPRYNMNWPRFECFRDPVPISRDYFLVSHAPADRFALYVIDRYGNRELLYIDPTIGSMCPTALRPVTRPPRLPSALDPKLAQAGLARLSLMDVHAGLQPEVEQGRIKYLRICQEVRADLTEMPDGQCRDDHESFQDWYATPTHKVSGPYGWPSYVAKASLGLVPLQKDGSATFDVPAGKMLYFEALDKDFNEIQRMRSVVQLHPGEQRGCIGCHENRRAVPPCESMTVRSGSVTRLIPPPWGSRPFAYEQIVQPVWNAHCVRCHDQSDAHGFNLTGSRDAEKIPASYRTLISGGWVHYFDYTWKLQHHKASPMSFGTLRSKLWNVLNTPHHDVALTRNEVLAIKCWIDLNCPLWPDYQFRPDRVEQVVPIADRSR